MPAAALARLPLEPATSAIGLVDLGTIDRPAPLGAQASEMLRSALRRGTLRPGQRLTTRDVAATLSISPTPAREAITRLVAEGVLELGADRTAVVPVLTRARYEELFLIRSELEALAGRLACGRVEPDRLARLESIYRTHAAAVEAGDGSGALAANATFHNALYEACGLPTLIQMIDSLWLQVGPSLTLLFSGGAQGPWIGATTHRAMIRAIRTGDAEAMGAAIRQDLNEGRGRLLPLLPA